VTLLTILIYLAIYAVRGAVWGWAVNKVVENKGYRENWFWWGFFFGILALIVALTKPDLPRTADESRSYFEDSSSIVGKNYVFKGFGAERKADYTKGEWRCTNCGQVNAGYVGTCGCGCEKTNNVSMRAPEKRSQEPSGWKCQRCGKINASYVGTCGCGGKKSESMSAGKDGRTQQGVLFCTSCGEPIEDGFKFCKYCGAETGM